MQQRVPLLFITGALAFGTLGYFMFIYDDGSIPGRRSLNHPLPTKKIGAGAGKPTGSAAPSGDPAAPTPPPAMATTPAPVSTEAPE